MSAKNFTLLVLMVGALVLPDSPAQAQQRESDLPVLWKVGAGLGMQLNSHQTDMNSAPGIPSCAPNFRQGRGSGLLVSLFGAKQISPDILVGLRAELRQLDGTFNLTQHELIDDHGAVDASIDYTLETKLSTVALCPEITYNAGPLSFHGGFSAGFIMSSHFDQVERISSPSDVVFENDRKDRMNFSGPIDQLSAMTLAIDFGLSSSFALGAGHNWSVEPRLSYSHMLGNVLSNGTPWNIHQLSFGVSVVYTKHEEKAVIVTPVVPPPVPIEPPPPPAPLPVPVAEMPKPQKKLMTVRFQPSLRDTSKQRMELQFVVRNTVSQNTYAMINYVFFDSASSKIPARYKLLSTQEKERFRTAELNATSTMQIYYNILNLVGSRMKDDPSTRITLVGCNSGDGAEKNNMSLSRARAEEVKNYISSTWGIDASRISISVRNLPEFPSNSTTTDGIEENRRVEIRTESSELLEPLIFSDTTSKLNAASVSYPGAISDSISVSSWTLSIISDGKVVTTLGDQGPPPKEIVWDTENDQEHVQQIKGSLAAALRVVDSDGQVYTAEADAVKVQHRRVQSSTIQRFSLITFGFNTSTISKSDRRIISLIKKNISSNSTVHVIGYTDRVGEAEHNQQLSEQRAQQVARILNVPLDNAKGEGAGSQLYDNSTPEGRFYSRTVIVSIETPVD